jgi:RNA polymerase sigma factor (sigma-70 family)
MRRCRQRNFLLRRGRRSRSLSAADDDTLLAVDKALTKLAKEDPDSAEFIKLRFFAGMTNDEAAQALGIPERTARRHWSFARAWLFREIRRQGCT